MTRSNSDGTWSLDPDDFLPLIATSAGAHVGAWHAFKWCGLSSQVALCVATAALVWPLLWLGGRALGLWSKDTGFRWRRR